MADAQTISKIFRAYDVRGVYPTDVDEETAESIARVYVQAVAAAGVRQILVAHDVRLSSPQLALAFIKGASIAGGPKVAFAGLLPIGTAAFHAHKSNSELAYITASHLPPEWNGIKFVHPTGEDWREAENFAVRDTLLQSIPPAPAEPEKPEQITVRDADTPASQPRTIQDYVRVRSNGHIPAPSAKSQHTVIDPDTIIANYSRELVAKVRPRRRLRVVLDCGNGSASTVAPKLFALGGFDVKALWAQPDGRFPNRPSEPGAENLTRLSEAVRSERASLGVAYDGDADRMAVIDDTGRVLTAEQVSYVILSELLKTAKGAVVANVECTRLIDEIMQRFGRPLVRVRVGHNFVREAMEENKAAFGLESSGHYAMPALTPFSDALAISYYLACALSRQDSPLSALLAELPVYPFERINFVCADEQKFAIIERLKLKLAQDNASINTMDGVRVDFPDGWALIRASNTEPKIRLTVEATSPESFARIKEEFANMLQKELNATYKPSFFAKLAALFGGLGKPKPEEPAA